MEVLVHMSQRNGVVEPPNQWVRPKSLFLPCPSVDSQVDASGARKACHTGRKHAGCPVALPILVGKVLLDDCCDIIGQRAQELQSCSKKHMGDEILAVAKHTPQCPPSASRSRRGIQGEARVTDRCVLQRWRMLSGL